ncbi:transcriptional regulator MraZ [Bacteroidia bacterium]|nr:transcriptional regulator MraZ [Bacteroidia bacterium]
MDFFGIFMFFFVTLWDKNKTLRLMAILIGKEYCKMDVNGRFKFPLALKKLLTAVIEDGFIIKESLFDACLELWPRKEFEKELSENIAKLNQYNPQDRLIIRKLSEGNPIDLDGNDRLLIPGDQRKAKNIDKDIVLISKNNLIEIWDVATYRALESASKQDIETLIVKRLGQISTDTEKD